MNEFLLKYFSRNSVMKYNFRWFKSGVARDCLRQGCVFNRNEETFLGRKGYSKYTYYLIRDYTRLSCKEPIWCPFSVEEINYCLKEINRVLGKKKIKWKISEAEICEVPTFILKVYIPNKYNNIQHLYILTRIRCLYEAPFCLYMMDALKLQAERNFQGGIEEAYIKVLNHSPSNPNNYFIGRWSVTPFDSVRCVISDRNVVFPGLDYIKQGFLELDEDKRIHNIYKKTETSFPKIPAYDNRHMDLDWWINGYYDYRRPYYLDFNPTPKFYERKVKLVEGYPSSSLEYKLDKWMHEIFNK